MFHIPPKKLLVAVDLSEPSAHAWTLATRLADLFGGIVEAAYVHEPLTEAEPPDASSRLDADLKEEIVSQLRRRVGPDAPLHYLRGEPAAALLRAARSRRADMIVLGTHGRTGVSRLVLGSVAEAVVRRSPVPVLTVQHAADTIASVLAPVNFTPYSDYAFEAAGELAAGLRARLTALHVDGDPKAMGPAARKLTTLLLRLPDITWRVCRPEPRVLNGEISEAILEESSRYGLIVLAGHRKGPVSDWVLGTTAERLLRRSSVPVLTIPVGRGRRQGRLPAAAGAEAAVGAVETLTKEHRALERRLDGLGAALAAARPEAPALAAELWSAFLAHEAVERRLLGELRRASGDLYAAQAMEEDHGRLEGSGKVLRAAIDGRGSLGAAASEFSDGLRYHMKREEEEVFPLLRQLLDFGRLGNSVG